MEAASNKAAIAKQEEIMAKQSAALLVKQGQSHEGITKTPGATGSGEGHHREGVIVMETSSKNPSGGSGLLVGDVEDAAARKQSIMGAAVRDVEVDFLLLIADKNDNEALDKEEILFAVCVWEVQLVNWRERRC